MIQARHPIFCCLTSHLWDACPRQTLCATASRESDTAEYDLPVVLDRGSRATRRSPRKRVRWVVALVAAAGSSAGVASTANSASALPTVACDKWIDNVPPDRRPGYRVVLGDVGIPPAYLGQSFPTGKRPWRFFEKAGLVIRAGIPPVVISVAAGARNQAAIGWAQSGTVPALRLASCPLHGWNAYPGGFYLRASSGCVPLVVQVGARSATVRVGIRRRCG